MTRRVGDVAAIPLPGGGFGAVQISGITDDLTTAYSLDFYSDELPDLAAVANAAPLRVDHYKHGGHIDVTNIGDFWPEPPDMVWLGNQSLREGAPTTSNVSSAWETLAVGIRARRRWWLETPEADRIAYRRATGTTRRPQWTFPALGWNTLNCMEIR